MTDQRRSFDDMPPAQQAGILCNSDQFQSFVRVRLGLPGDTSANPSVCAEYIRQICRIDSRKELASNPDAARLFGQIRTSFDAWRGRIPAPR